MTIEENKRLTRVGFERVWSQDDPSASQERYVDNYILHLADGSTLTGPQGHAQVVTMLRAAFPDLEIVVEDQVAEGDKVANRLVARGTHRGEFMGIPPTGRAAKVTGMTFDRVSDGMLIESWACWDLGSLLQQLSAPLPLAAEG